MSRRAVERDVDEELRFHLAMRARRLAENGAETESVDDEARRRFGDLAAIRGQCVDIDWTHTRRGLMIGWIEDLGADLRFGVHQLRRTPLFSATIVLVLALGIAINSGMATMVNTYVNRPAIGIDPDPSLVRLMPERESRTRSSRRVPLDLSYPDIIDLRARSDVFSAVATWTTSRLVIDFGGGPESEFTAYVSSNYFQTLRVRLAAGTGFPLTDDFATPPLAVISSKLAGAHYGDVAAAIGKDLRVMGHPFRVVGVAPPGFVGVNSSNMGRSSVWIPMSVRSVVEPAVPKFSARSERVLDAVARLQPGIDPDEVANRLQPTIAHIGGTAATSSERLETITAHVLTGLAPEQQDEGVVMLGLLALVSALVIAITCTNVSALLLGRAVSRRQEIGVRLAMGAARSRVVRQLLTECSILALAGGALGVALYVGATKVAYATIPALSHGLEPTTGTFVYAALFAGITTFAFGLAPALHATRADIANAIKASGSTATRRSRLQATLIVAQLACSQPVLIVTALVLADVRSNMYERAASAPSEVMSVQLETDEIRFMYGAVRPASQGAIDSSRARNRAKFETIRRTLGEMPGVASASYASTSGGRWFRVPSGGRYTINAHYVAPGYFATLGVPLLAGRAIGNDENHAMSSVALVNDAAAQLLWPGETPVGKRLVHVDGNRESEGRTLDVIGVAGSAAYDTDRRPVVYLPTAASESPFRVEFIVRGRGDPRPLLPDIRRAIAAIDPMLPVVRARTLAEQFADRRLEAVQMNAATMAVAIVALALASLGLYAIIAYAVAQRTREIGIRLAIGATHGAVVREFFAGGMKVVALGVAIGIPITVIGIKLAVAGVVGFSARNIGWAGIVVSALVAVSVLACWLPARRAGRVDPLVALRAE